MTRALLRANLLVLALVISQAFSPLGVPGAAAEDHLNGNSRTVLPREPGFRFDRARAVTPPPLQQEAMIAAPAANLTAASAIAVDVTTGDLLYQSDADSRRAPASTLKIITALTALEVLDPDEEIIVQQEDLVDTTVYSNAALLSGDVVTVEDLLAGALIPSGGDAAKALARVAGARLGPAPGQRPLERFVDEMNAVSQRLGMRNSNFENPDGADSAEQYTTARDLAIAGRALLDNRLLAEQVAQVTYEITITGQNARSYEVINTNDLLEIDRVHGVKTGTTGDAGENVVLATRRGDNQILTVVMGSEARYQDTQSLLGHIDGQVTWVEFGATDDFPGVRSAADRFEFVLATPMTRPILNGDVTALHSKLSLGPRPESAAPISWGYVVFLNDGEELYRVPIMTSDQGAAD